MLAASSTGYSFLFELDKVGRCFVTRTLGEVLLARLGPFSMSKFPDLL
uniref:Uncharacterized protein n=1 Tax=Arundo donax TaxID=35708 RepID=A0A0A8Y5V6_ARUDO